MKTVIELFDQVLDLFKDSKRFAQDYYQYDKDGNKCGWREGYCFCALGAICYFSNIDDEVNEPVAGYSLQYVADCLIQRVSEYLYQGQVIQTVNDSPGGYQKVMDAFHFAKKYWEGKTITESDLSKPITLEQVMQEK